MIANLNEYQISKNTVKSFQDALENFDQHPPEGDQILIKAQRDSLASQLEDLLEEVQAFETLQSATSFPQ
jgi:hypothetical protein